MGGNVISQVKGEENFYQVKQARLGGCFNQNEI